MTPPSSCSKVLGFATRNDADDWMLAHPLQTIAAVHFDTGIPSRIGFTIQTNTTTECAARRQCSDGAAYLRVA